MTTENSITPQRVNLSALLTSLIAKTPNGLDPVLDSYRTSDSGDPTFSTAINRQVRSFLIYYNYVKDCHNVLDWGCRHALDACMLRSINPTANIFGCDINPVISEATQRFARLEYTQLKHAWLLPYEDNKFDAIIAAGVIEHVPFPARSLEELYRVMEEGGTLVITFLPNAKSYTELAARTLVKAGYHHRIYNKKVIGDLLKTHGFEPLIVGHHQVLPSLAMGHYSLKNKFVASALRRLFKLDPFVEKVWPFKVFSANLYVIARKRAYM